VHDCILSAFFVTRDAPLEERKQPASQYWMENISKKSSAATNKLVDNALAFSLTL
jgi:hypothetical protein